MREIKFRGKSTMTTEQLRLMGMGESGWVYGNLISNGNKPYIVGGIVDVSDEYLAHEFWIPVDPKTVGQYTGLKDKNGTEICEGDIVCIKHTYDYLTFEGYERGYFYIKNAYVKFKHGAFDVYHTNKEGQDVCAGIVIQEHLTNIEIEWEVVGNIYESELLEVTE